MSLNLHAKTIEKLDPINFAFIMATGIVSIILFNNWPILSLMFLIIGIFGYIGLIFLFLTRTFLLGRQAFEELKNVQFVFKYLTFSIGSNTLATRFCIDGHDFIGLILGVVGTISTIVLAYTVFCLFFCNFATSIRTVSPSLLLLPIACNSTGIIIICLWDHQVLTYKLFLLFAFIFWAFGVITYLIFMTLNIYRLMFTSFKGKDLNPTYWIFMGAAAIAVVDGSHLILAIKSPQFLNNVKPFIEGMVLLLWAWASAWIPILIIMMMLKYAYFKMPFHYHPLLWAMIFPLGMYTAATDILSSAITLDDIQGMVFIWRWITIILWILVFSMGIWRYFRFNYSV